jgi:SHS family lactate transporter-like MFS transporter
MRANQLKPSDIIEEKYKRRFSNNSPSSPGWPALAGHDNQSLDRPREGKHMPFAALKGWTSEQKHVVAASYVGWTLDAFDYFLLVLVLTDVAKEFGVSVKLASWATFWTLAMRPVGAYMFGRLADHFGRRPIMMVDVLTYAGLAFVSAFAPNLIVFVILRALFGVAMGGEWGVGASLTMESIPAESRGLVSGILQAGYPSGYLLASIAYGILFPMIGWRGLFMVGIAPAFLVLYIRRSVPESPGWNQEHARASDVIGMLKRHWRLALYAVLLMTCFNYYSHGTQDVYPTFLKADHLFDPHTVSIIQVVYNVGAILGGLTLGSLSQRLGRRRTLISGALLSLFVLPLWAYSTTPVALAIGAFIMQFLVQGCWGVIPAHLNELSPPEARATFPGVVYQLGNLFAAYNLPLQAGLAVTYGSYAISLVIVAASAALGIALFAYAGREAKDVDMQLEARQAA